ncbi:MAG TPA: ATP-binding protein [Ilumatobacteraceae bacterium]|nr:ATP-binding protein [Ilumatobacteraceae bacterium]
MPADARTIFPTAITVARALVAARWLVLLWMVGVVVVSSQRDAIEHPLVTWMCVAAVASVAAWTTWAVRVDPVRLFGTGFLMLEATLAIGLSVIDGWVFEPGHVFEVSQSLATQYPLIAVVSIGLARGPIVAGAFGLLIGPAEWAGAVLNEFDDWSARHAVSLIATSLFYAAAGAVFGWQAQLLRQAEADIADRRARDDVARVLHDTVLQTLALVERRTVDSDPALARTAREADRDLRRFLFGSTTRVDDTLEQRVRAAVERSARHHDAAATVPISVSVVDTAPPPPDAVADAVASAIGEAVANALEHAAPSRVVVFVETDDDGDVFASVRDDGSGFDPSERRTGHGVDESIVARMHSVGGRADVVSTPGAGTEVRVWST